MGHPPSQSRLLASSSLALHFCLQLLEVDTEPFVAFLRCREVASHPSEHALSCLTFFRGQQLLSVFIIRDEASRWGQSLRN